MRVLEGVENEENKDLPPNRGLLLGFVSKASRAVGYKYNEVVCLAVIKWEWTVEESIALIREICGNLGFFQSRTHACEGSLTNQALITAT